MKQYIPEKGVPLQVVTDFGTLTGLLAGRFSRENLVRTEGGKANSLINIVVGRNTLYFNCENLRNPGEGIVATTYDGGYGYIGLPVKLFKPEYQKQILEQLRERHGR